MINSFPPWGGWLGQLESMQLGLSCVFKLHIGGGVHLQTSKVEVMNYFLPHTDIHLFIPLLFVQSIVLLPLNNLAPL